MFINNDRPGVMLAGAARCYLNRYAVLPGSAVVVATNNDSAWETALRPGRRRCRGNRASISVPNLARNCRQRARGAGVHFVAGARGTRAVGRRHVRGVQFTCDGRLVRLRLRPAVGISAGWSPAVHLTSHTGVKPVYHSGIDGFVPGGSPAGTSPPAH